MVVNVKFDHFDVFALDFAVVMVSTLAIGFVRVHDNVVDGTVQRVGYLKQTREVTVLDNHIFSCPFPFGVEIFRASFYSRPKVFGIVGITFTETNYCVSDFKLVTGHISGGGVAPRNSDFRFCNVGEDLSYHSFNSLFGL